MFEIKVRAHFLTFVSICLSSIPFASWAGDTYYWVQTPAKHPQHQITRTAFKERCSEQKMKCEAVGTEEDNIPETISRVSHLLDEDKAAGLAIWVGGTKWKDVIAKAEKANIPVILVHTPPSSGRISGVKAEISGDIEKAINELASAVVTKIGSEHGTFAITQGSFNDTENTVAQAFIEKINLGCPHLKILAPTLEGFDEKTSVEVAESIIRENQDLVGSFSTTALGARTWALAQRNTGRRILALGGNQLGENLDYVKNGEIFALGWSPFVELAQAAADIFFKLQSKIEVGYRTIFPRPIITLENVDDFRERHRKDLDSISKI